MMVKEKKHHWATEKEKKKSISKIRIFFRPILVYYFLLIFFLGVVIYAFVFSDFLLINDIQINTQGTISREDIKKTIEENISNKKLKIFSKRNFIFFNSKEIEKIIKYKFKKIKVVRVEKKFPDKVKVEIEERDLILTLCSRGECFFVDENGYAYEKIDSQISEEIQAKVIKLIDESGKEIREGEYVLLPRFVEYMVDIAGKIKTVTGIEILREYRTRSRISEEVIIQTNKGWDIYLNAKLPVDKSMQTFKTLLNRHLMLKDLNELEYIDLRSENRVFYRMIGGVEQEEEELKKEAELSESPEESQEQNDKPTEN